MTSDFHFTVTSRFPGNVRVKPYSKHSGGWGVIRLVLVYKKRWEIYTSELLSTDFLNPPPFFIKFYYCLLLFLIDRCSKTDIEVQCFAFFSTIFKLKQLGGGQFLVTFNMLILTWEGREGFKTVFKCAYISKEMGRSNRQPLLLTLSTVHIAGGLNVLRASLKLLLTQQHIVENQRITMTPLFLRLIS